MRVEIATQNELEIAATFAFERNNKPDLRGRPFVLETSFDKIKRDYESYIVEENKNVLLVYDKDDLVGVSGIFCLPEDLYVSITRGVFFKGDYKNVVDCIITYIEENFRTYNLYINTAKEHVISIDYYTQHDGFEQLEDAVLYLLTDYNQSKVHPAIQYGCSDNKDAIYNLLDTQITEDTYWNIERLKANEDKFVLIGYFDQGIKGALNAQIYKSGFVEVMGTVGDIETRKAMIDALGVQCQAIEAKGIQLYTEDQDEIEVAKTLGYSYSDSNVCFINRKL